MKPPARKLWPAVALALVLAVPQGQPAAAQQAKLPPEIWKLHYDQVMQCFDSAKEYRALASRQLRIDEKAMEEAGLKSGAAILKMRTKGLSDTAKAVENLPLFKAAGKYRYAGMLRQLLHRCLYELNAVARKTLTAWFGDEQDIAFWARVSGATLPEFTADLSKGTPTLKAEAARTGRYVVDEGKTRPPSLGGQDELLHGTNVYFKKYFLEQDANELNENEADSTFSQESEKRAQAKWCKYTKPAFSNWQSYATEDFGPDFNRVGRELINFTGIFLSTYRAYATEALNYMNSELGGSPLLPQSAAQFTRDANQRYRTLIRELLSRRSKYRWSVARFLHDRAKWYEKQQVRQAKLVANKHREITEKCSGLVTPIEPMPALETSDIDKALEAFRYRWFPVLALAR